MKRNLASVFVLVAKADLKTILAYYTLSSRELRLEQLPPAFAKRAGKYGHVGVTLLGRMAVAEKYKGMGLGKLCLMSALDKSLLAAKDVASWAVFVEAVDASAASFYRKFGFIELPEDGLKLFLPMATIAKAFALSG